MAFLLSMARRMPLALAYLVVASLTVSLNRYDDGASFLWVASPLLIADLMTRPRRHWAASILPCAAASGLATGLFGLGWPAALPFAGINMLEAALAAWIFRRYGDPLRPLASLSWLMHFVISVGIAAPLVCAVLAAATMAALGKPPAPALINFFTDHALGNITLTPMLILLMRGSVRKPLKDRPQHDPAQSLFLLLLVLATTAIVFTQPILPMLFLPVVPIILVTFRVGRGGAAIALAVLAVVGGGATMAGLGPFQWIDAADGARAHFFQFYLATTALTVLPVAADLQNRLRLHRALRLSEERYRLLADHSTDILLHLEVDGRIRYVSPSIRHLAGHDPQALIGRSSRILVAAEHLDLVSEAHLAMLAGRGQTRTFEYLGLAADGSRRWFETHGCAILDDAGEIDGVICVVRDVSARKAYEERLAADAMTDPLTGLPNRRAYCAAIERRPLDAAANMTDCVAMLDLDHFKVVNDSFGHAAGDEVLRGFAKVARRMVRGRDIVARVGGEEFAIFFPDTSIEQAMLVCDRLRAEMARTTFRAGSSTVRVTVSGGVGRIGPEGIDHALEIADLALYHAKSNGRDRFARAA